MRGVATILVVLLVVLLTACGRAAPTDSVDASSDTASDAPTDAVDESLGNGCMYHTCDGGLRFCELNTLCAPEYPCLNCQCKLNMQTQQNYVVCNGACGCPP